MTAPTPSWTTAATPSIRRPRRVAPPAAERAGRHLHAGIVVGPLFAAVVVAQLVVHDAFDLSRHPISLLATGDHGWVQIANFVAAGVLVILAARGLRAHLTEGRGRVWIPRLIAAFGVGLVLSGVFVADADLGYPAGTPAGPAELSWHGILHAASAAVAYNALIAAMIVVAVRVARQGRRAAAATHAVTAVVLLGLLSQPTAPGVSVRMAAGAVVAFGWLASLCVAAHRGDG